MLPFALTIFTGAFLLFQVQPLIGKYILPWFGGSPGVWTTCLLFFQVLLLGGYAYAHLLTTRLRPKHQFIVHLVLVGIALSFLPITPDESWKPAGTTEPVGRILLLLGATIGFPYFVLSATGPLLQQWFSQSRPGVLPYRLYALSNVGSLLALLSYPFFFEPRLTRQEQSQWWGWGLVAYAAFCLWAGFRTASKSENELEKTDVGMADEEKIPSLTRALWIAFPALASVILLSTTNKLCQDVAVVPFLWVLPLALYLLTFILCFDHPRWYQRGTFTALFVLAGATIGALLINGTTFKLDIQVIGYCGGLFVACMICHGELYRLKPSARYLTQYYLCISAGGALGGCLVALGAPAIFDRYVELQIGLGVLMYLLGVVCIVQRSRELAVGAFFGVLLSLILIPVVLATKLVALNGWWGAIGRSFGVFYEEYWHFAAGVVVASLWFVRGDGFRWPKAWHMRQAGVPMLLAFTAGIFFVHQIGDEKAGSVEASRNFYGTLTVVSRKQDEARLKYLALTHGNITHGMQFTETPLNRLITTYYGELSGVGRAIRATPSLGGKRIGVVGLGTGTLAMYGVQGDRLRFYEINPAVEDLARSRFNYLAQSRASIEIILGDARLSLDEELSRGELQQFDVLALDAFSSDAIPVHLLTKEAFELYLQHMNWGGIIAVHTSNRYLRLDPAIYRVARELGLHVATIHDEPDDSEWWLYRSTWILLSRTQEALSHENVIEGIGPLPIAPSDVRLWTDDFASVLPLLK